MSTIPHPATSSTTTTTAKPGLEKVLALHTFTAENDDELSFEAGEYVWILEKDEVYGDGWWKGRNRLDAKGLFPASYILPDGVDPSPYLAMQSGNGGLSPGEIMPSPPSPGTAGTGTGTGTRANGVGNPGETGRFDALGEGERPGGGGTTVREADSSLGPAEIAAARVAHDSGNTTGGAKPRALSRSPTRSPPARRPSTIDEMTDRVQAALDETNARVGSVTATGLVGQAISPAMSDARTTGQDETPRSLNVSGFPQPPTPKSPASQGIATVDKGSSPDATGHVRNVSDVMPVMPRTASITSLGTDGNESIVSNEDEADRAAGAGGVRSRLAESARLENLKGEQKVAREAEDKRKREEGLGLGLSAAGGPIPTSSNGSNGNANGINATAASNNHGGGTSFGGFKVPNGFLNSAANGNNKKTGVRMSAGAGMASGLVYSDESDASDSDEEEQRELEKRLSGNDGFANAMAPSAMMGSPTGGRLAGGDAFGWSGPAANAFGVKSPSGQSAKEFAAAVPTSTPTVVSAPALVTAAPPSANNVQPAAFRETTTSPYLGLGGALPPFPSSIIAGTTEPPSSAPTPRPTGPSQARDGGSGGGLSGVATPQPREEDRTPLAPAPALLAPVALRAGQQLQPSFMAMDESPGGTAYLGSSNANGSAQAVPEYDPMAAKGAELVTKRDSASVENAQKESMGPPPAPAAALLRQASSDLIPQRPASGGPGSARDWAHVPGDAHLWTIQQVVEWAQAKGFDRGICDKFAENEIDGEVLLSLDVNLLKELDIPQFGKRIKIANAINELRRPASNISAGHASEARSSRQISSGYNGGQGGAYHRPSSTTSAQSPLGGAGYPASPTYGVYGESQPTHSRSTSTAGQNYAAAQEGGLGYDQPRKASEGSGPATGYAEWAHGKVQQGRKASAHDSFKGMNAPIREEEENGRTGYITPSSQVVTPEPPSTETLPAFAAPLSTPHTATTTASSIRSRNSSIPASPSTPNTKHSSLDRGASFALGHKKDKSAGDRSSFFGGRARKPAPRFPSSASNVAVDRPTNDVAPSPNGKNGIRSMMGRNTQRVSGAPSISTSMVSAPTSPARTAARKPGTGIAVASAVSKIGTPDYSGYMKKKGENYRSWKMRYFVLKGAHLYYMRNESEERIKGHIDLQGYKVMADGNTGAGTYGFQIVHDRAASHSFSSNEQRVVKEWMKQLMKATITRDYGAPVVSSCNIPTIPLKEAQALQPRPPSPSERDATQRATRRENPNQLTARDASVLMSLDNSPASPTQSTTKRNSMPPNGKEPKSPSLGRKSGDRYVRNVSISSAAGLGIGGGAYSGGNGSAAALPPRPSREARMASNASSMYPTDTRSGGSTPRPPGNTPTFGGAALLVQAGSPNATQGRSAAPTAEDRALIEWVNAHMPSHETARATLIPDSFISGKHITRVIEYFVAPPFPPPSNPSSSIPASAEQFEPIGGEANLEGLFTMMDKAIDEGMDTGGVSINDVRMGHANEIRKLLESLRSWGEAKRSELRV